MNWPWIKIFTNEQEKEFNISITSMYNSDDFQKQFTKA